MCILLAICAYLTRFTCLIFFDAIASFFSVDFVGLIYAHWVVRHMQALRLEITFSVVREQLILIHIFIVLILFNYGLQICIESRYHNFILYISKFKYVIFWTRYKAQIDGIFLLCINFLIIFLLVINCRLWIVLYI